MRNKDKHKGIIKILYKFKYSFDGLIYYIKSEVSFLIIMICALLLSILGIYFKISLNEWVYLILSLSLVLVVELLNTALEIIIDMITLKYNELAKHSKDIGSAATFIMAFIAGIISCIIFIPKILALF